MREGDITALGVLFDRHAERVHAYCARSAGDVVDPEDTLSETFLEAWRSRRSFVVRDGSALPILLAIAKRVVQKLEINQTTDSALTVVHERAEAVWRAEGDATRLAWSIDYERTYEPSWYFGPIQSYATDLAAEYLAATFGAASPEGPR